MPKQSGFHVRHDLQPGFVYELLMLLHPFPQGQEEESLRQLVNQQGYSLRQRKDYGKLVNSLRELGMVEKSGKVVRLSERGHIIAELSLYQRRLLPELVHFLYYAQWDWDKEKRFSWSYRTVTDWLWTTAPCAIRRDRLVNLVTNSAGDAFGVDGVSFSAQSVMGILYWLSALHPCCVDEGMQAFTRRPYCGVESFVLALHHVYQLYAQQNTSIPLTPGIRQQVCQLSLLAPEAFDDMLAQTEASFSCVQVRRERGERLAITGFRWELLKE